MGGLIGFNTHGSEVQSSQASGDVSGDNRLGGLIGENSHLDSYGREEIVGL